MKFSQDIENEVLRVHSIFWESYAKRDIDLRFSLCSEDITFIGSGLHERAKNRTEYKKINQEGVKQFPNPFQIEFLWTNLMLISENVACVESEVIWSQLINNETSKELLRNTTLLKYDKDKWLITHVHGSVPDYRLKDGDYMTNEQTIIRNKELERQVFERTQDLKKTLEELEQNRKAIESQNRELEIEGSLERVRSQALGMTKPEDLLRVCAKLFIELQTLGFDKLRNAIIHILNDEKGFFWDYDYSDFSGGCITTTFYNSHPILNNFLKQIKSANDAFAEVVIDGNQLSDWKEFRRKSGQPDDSRLDNIPALYYYFYSIGIGDVGISTFNPIDENQLEILKRFRNVFELAYRRFIDIQKAEAQARESQIELGLERVRARAMAMQSSDELKELIGTVFTELTKLDLVLTRCIIWVFEPATHAARWWMANSEEPSNPLSFYIKYHEYPAYLTFVNEWKNQNIKFVYDLNGKDKTAWDDILFKETELKQLPDAVKEGMRVPGRVLLSASFNNFGGINVASLEPLSDEHFDILLRFAKVFDLTYTRFNDLKKAEAQAREAQIETSLERIRSRTMVMQQSSDLHEVIKVVTDQLSALGIKFNVANFAKIHSEGSWDLWISTPEQSYPALVHVPYLNHGLFNNLIEIISKGIDFLADVYDQEEKNIFFKHFFENTLGKNTPEERKQFVMNCKGLARSIFLTKNIWLAVSNYDVIPFSDEENAIFKRFAAVFEQTYTRFLDLQKAEEQTREAKIEASLEKVRTVALSLEKSDEMLDIAQVLYEQLIELGFNNIRNAIIDIHNDKNETFLDYDYSLEMGRTVTLMSYYDDPIIEKQVREIESSSDAFFEIILEGKDLQDLIDIRLKNGEAEDPRLRKIEQLTYNLYSFGNGAIGISNFGLLSDVQKIVLKRFRNVFAFAYKRYTDMVSAETQAREAKKQTSLDRIRAEIASMRTSEDLNHITPIIWRELKNLEVPFIRCGVFIVDEEKEYVQVFLTTPDGKSLAALSLSFDANDITSNTVAHWKKKQVYKEHWNKEEFLNWTKSMIQIGQVQSTETYQGSSVTPESLDLHFIPFDQGMLYVGDIQPLRDEKLDLIKTLAEAFSIAYARYEDFKNLEEAKNKIEITLKELKSAQVQLIHSEKMASLGELTAGIAHEIKNPLNFVNNFSEVSQELLDEMIEELRNKNTDEVIDLIQDLKRNLDKINQHGKRADSIVKGMLLHSRGTSGEKTLTDINDLLDQYVNLAYHGMRAQNKEFNITIEKDYDETLEKISVVPQDISRVFLNIINNACYAAYDKKKKNSENNFSPTLSVSTKNLVGKVEVRISDNGNGIKVDHLDKIFQPFFTTKPSGEGTGLGLSLSYDVVTKVHGGELKVESEEGKYTEFVISLPKV